MFSKVIMPPLKRYSFRTNKINRKITNKFIALYKKSNQNNTLSALNKIPISNQNAQNDFKNIIDRGKIFELKNLLSMTFKSRLTSTFLTSCQIQILL